MNVLVAGATGLVGNFLVKELAKDKSIHTIYVLSRRPIEPIGVKVKVLVADFDHLEATLDLMEDVEAVFSCLGTTKSQTPDSALYEKIEIHYPLTIARWAREHGVSQFHYISSIGTNINAKSEYLSRKAVAEQELMHSQISQVFIYRPSFITGVRAQARPLERVGGLVLKAFQPLLVGKAKKYRPISACDIAKAMTILSTRVQPGVFILESDEISEISKKNECKCTAY
jgi:uncharacterized protein YbjT (DUF2867 family)